MTRPLLPLLLATGLAALPLRAETICTRIADAATGEVLLDDGDCTTRVTPASTFKIPLAVIGFETGVLQDAETPRLAYRPGDPSWGGADWRQDTTPARWMRYSVVWYSQRITRPIGRARLEHLTAAFGFGNADFSGDPGQDNGLDRAWLSASLQVSPAEQVSFLRRLLSGTLPASDHAHAQTIALIQRHDAGPWTIHGKTGAAYPRKGYGFDYNRGYGWFVGWATREDRQLVFARLSQDQRRHQISPGHRTRDGVLADWPALMSRIGESP